MGWVPQQGVSRTGCTPTNSSLTVGWTAQGTGAISVGVGQVLGEGDAVSAWRPALVPETSPPNLTYSRSMLRACDASQSAVDPSSGVVTGQRSDLDARPGWSVVTLRAAGLNHHDVRSLQGVGPCGAALLRAWHALRAAARQSDPD